MRWTAILVLALGAAPIAATAASVGVGVFGGTSIPVVQDDNKAGPLFGVRIPVALVRLVTVEPYFQSTKDGDATQEIGGLSYTRSGFDIRTFGLNAMLTFGGRLEFYPLVGVSTNKLTRPGSEDQTMTGFSFGLGLGFSPIPRLRIHVRGVADALTKSGTGRTFGNATLGASYNFFDFPGIGGGR